jgi:hypothetical protein
MAAKRSKRAPTRKPKATAKPKVAARATKRRSPARAFKPKTAARTKGQARRHAARPVCPICGSRDVEVVQPAGKAKAQSKLAAGVVLPLLVERHGGLTCNSCGYREEAVA